MALGVDDCLAVEAVMLSSSFLDRDAVRGCISKACFSFDELRAAGGVGLVGRAVTVYAPGTACGIARVGSSTFFTVWGAGVTSRRWVAEEPTIFAAEGGGGGGVDFESHCRDLYSLGKLTCESK